ncbi:MAG: acetyltransferase (GNAT) family protein [Stygiobacter sp.]|nr:MAG: acetyltransferase (GNAT) family protein [Stygiobacter sp.]KAF0218198.1 MAG: acetyltransferase (GNAT) family [Ignavibacteria bacterium]
MKLTYKPLTVKNWNDFETLFGERGACGGCWCMAWRLKSSQFEKQKGNGNKKSMKHLVENKEQIGVVAYDGKTPVGWCSFAPREKYLRLENSKVLSPVDDKAVWSITCFFMAKDYRRKGVSSELLKFAIEFCKKKKVKILEGYPTVPYSNTIPAAFAWTGIPASFERAGFVEVARRSKARPIMRYYL